MEEVLPSVLRALSEFVMTFFTLFAGIFSRKELPSESERSGATSSLGEGDRSDAQLPFASSGALPDAERDRTRQQEEQKEEDGFLLLALCSLCCLHEDSSRPKTKQPRERTRQASSSSSGGRPNFGGEWVLERVDGDVDTFLVDMGQGWFVRTGALAIDYGVGRVEISCRHEVDEDVIDFVKVLADPLQHPAHIPVRIGQGTVSYRDDIGRLTAVSKWDGDALQFDAALDKSELPVTLRMYYDSEGNFVEEMISCRGTTIIYVFGAK
mmetsp:Transcript_63571/g.207334  ORF Transcript_63571/g.207334 Transcript_63571/m.207334 type:complete len:267 (+) Transcript_63571:78-878(+)